MGPAGAYPAPVRCARRRRWVAPPHAGRLTTARGSGADGRSVRRPGIPALDGVRAVAVALVLADHGGLPGMGGGFLGVDVFFVLSGFLITSLLLDELGRSGRISLRDFWIRRARRLLPALVLMVLAVAVGRQFFSAEAVAGLREEAVAAFFWVANWMFVADKTDYFTQGACTVAAAARVVARRRGAGVLHHLASSACCGGRSAGHQRPVAGTGGPRSARGPVDCFPAGHAGRNGLCCNRHPASVRDHA